LANPTTNYGFVLPTSSDLVTDLPADFDVALQGVDTRLKALQPGTTLGDIAYSSATANTNTRLAIGSTGNVLTVSGGVPVWAAPAGGGGKVLQVINATYATEASTSSNTFIDTGLTATITPTLATSKVLVFVHQTGLWKNDGNAGAELNIKLVRGATDLAAFEVFATWTSSVQKNNVGGSGVTYLDSPATTSATTYKTQFRAATNVGAVYVNGGGSRSSITLMEIGA
jgi:hypothetical protein